MYIQLCDTLVYLDQLRQSRLNSSFFLVRVVEITSQKTTRYHEWDVFVSFCICSYVVSRLLGALHSVVPVFMQYVA